MIRIDQLRHPKEKMYFVLAVAGSIILWLLLLFSLIFFFVFIVWLIPLAIGVWVAGYYYKARVYGNAIEVSEYQYPEIYSILWDQARELGVKPAPHTFIVNNNIATSFAHRCVKDAYILLPADLLHLIPSNSRTDEFKFILARELGHHAAGHLNPLKNWLIAPARIIPFLGAAYGRVCELTADRIGAAMTRDNRDCIKALIAQAHGSRQLIGETDIDAFVRQYDNIPELIGLAHSAFSSRPSIIERIMELENFQQKVDNVQERPKDKPASAQDTKAIDLDDL